MVGGDGKIELPMNKKIVIYSAGNYIYVIII